MTKKKPLVVTVAGVPVRVYTDDEGRPLYATAGGWGDEGARHAELAAKHVFDTAKHAATRTELAKVKAQPAVANRESVRIRAKASVEHPANEWLALAHDKHPAFGRKKLCHTARRLAVDANVDPDILDEITEDRARRFLERQPNASQ